MVNLPGPLAERLAFEAELALLRPSQFARSLIAAALRERPAGPERQRAEAREHPECAGLRATIDEMGDSPSRASDAAGRAFPLRGSASPFSRFSEGWSNDHRRWLFEIVRALRGQARCRILESLRGDPRQPATLNASATAGRRASPPSFLPCRVTMRRARRAMRRAISPSASSWLRDVGAGRFHRRRGALCQRR